MKTNNLKICISTSFQVLQAGQNTQQLVLPSDLDSLSENNVGISQDINIKILELKKTSCPSLHCFFGRKLSFVLLKFKNRFFFLS